MGMSFSMWAIDLLEHKNKYQKLKKNGDIDNKLVKDKDEDEDKDKDNE